MKLYTIKCNKMQIVLLINYFNSLYYFISKESKFERIYCIGNNKNKIEQNKLNELLSNNGFISHSIVQN